MRRLQTILRASNPGCVKSCKDFLSLRLFLIVNALDFSSPKIIYMSIKRCNKKKNKWTSFILFIDSLMNYVIKILSLLLASLGLCAVAIANSGEISLEILNLPLVQEPNKTFTFDLSLSSQFE